MNIKELIFGGAVKTAGGGAWRDSIQAWLPIKNIINGVVITRDNRFIKILEVLPVFTSNPPMIGKTSFPAMRPI